MSESDPSALVLNVDPHALAELDRACGELAAALTDAQDRAAALGALTTWGLGENDPALRTAQALVSIFREKASGGPRNAHSVLGEYLASAEELRALFATVATALPQVDEEFAQQVGATRQLTRTPLPASGSGPVYPRRSFPMAWNSLSRR